MAVNEKIRIKIKGYEHAVVDAAAAKIVEAVKRSGAQVSGPSGNPGPITAQGRSGSPPIASGRRPPWSLQ